MASMQRFGCIKNPVLSILMGSLLFDLQKKERLEWITVQKIRKQLLMMKD
jgi:hypothetical protein